MIRTEREYAAAMKRIEEARDFADRQRDSLNHASLSLEQIELAMSPLLAFQDQMRGEVTWYEQARAGEVRSVSRLTDVGLSLIALRIARGLTQRQLAERLGINEAQVSKDERNGYHGLSIERAQRILDALDGAVTVTVTTRGAAERRPELAQTR